MALSRRSFIAGLVLLAGAGAGAGYAYRGRGAGQAASAGVKYTCSMHSHLRLDKPGNCPICNMTLVRVGAPAAAHTMAGDGMHVAPEAQRSMGLELVPVTSGPLARTIHAYASIALDDSTVVEVNPTVEGWVRAMHLRGVGDRVRRGQVLYEIYSPELQQRQREYIDLLVRKDGLLANDTMAIGASNAMMAGSLAKERFRNRARLIAAGMDEDLVVQLEQGRRVLDVVPIRAARDGVVTAIGARAGTYVTPMQQILAYADNRKLWAELTLFPDQLAWLRDGDRVRLRSTIDRSAVAEARLDLSGVQVDPGSRTARVRMALSGHGAAFAPGAFADATIASRPVQALSIPREALIRTGSGDYVLRAAPDNHFERIRIETGIEADEAIAVTSGLKAGDRVAVRAQFMLDGALALQANARPEPAPLPFRPGEPGGPDDPDMCRTPPAAAPVPAPVSHAGHQHGAGMP